MNTKFSGINASDETIIDYFISAIDYVIQIRRTSKGREVFNVLNVKQDLKRILANKHT